MNVTDLHPAHAAPSQITHHTTWLDLLLGNTRAAPSRAIPSQPARGLQTVVAKLPEHLEAADDLVRRRYAWRGYRVSARSRCEGSMDKGDTGSVTLLAQLGDRLLGTLTVRPGAEQDLLAAFTYHAEIQRLRDDGHRVGELVKLAVEEGADWRRALDALVQSAYLLTRVIHGLTDVVIEVNPRHVRFYQRVFGFVVAGAERVCARAGAPAVLLRLDLEEFGERLRSPATVAHA